MHFALHLLLFSFFLLPMALCQEGLRAKSHPAFGAPMQFSGLQLPTNLDVGKHFLWTYEQMTSVHGVTISHHEVALEVRIGYFFK